MTPVVDCPWCGTQHPHRVLCDPAAQALAALHEQARDEAAGNTVPFVEFANDPIPAEQFGTAGPGDQMIRQLVMQSAVAEVFGRIHPVIIFTGRRMDGSPLPRWTLVADVADMRGAARLVTDAAELAIKKAGGSGGGRGNGAPPPPPRPRRKRR